MTKRMIKESIKEGDAKKTWEMISEYEQECPKDPEIYLLKSRIALMINAYDDAKALAKEALRLLPYSADAHFNYALVCEACGSIPEAMEYYSKTHYMVGFGSPYSFEKNTLSERIGAIKDRLLEDTGSSFGEKYKAFFDFNDDHEWELNLSIFHSDGGIIGGRYYDYMDLPPFLVGFAKTSMNSFAPEKTVNTIFGRAEMQRLSARTYELYIDLDQDCYVPIIEAEDTIVKIEDDKGNTSEFLIYDGGQYYNLRFHPGHFKLSAEYPMDVGTIVPIEHNPDRKKVVLSIFIDGLSQFVIKDNMKELMPNTYEFFSKGIICTNAYSTADWTLPSITSACTGLSFAEHKMIHSKRLRKIELETPVLAEYFQSSGYNTSKIGGNWRITPTYGFGRGFNRITYQHQYMGFDPENKIYDTIEQLYSMKDTDQFIWLEIGDLHLVADEFNMGNILNIFPIMDIKRPEKAINSVKQEYDPQKLLFYREKIKYVDRRLAPLFRYLEENYSADEMLVTVFSDHGQGYLVENDGHSLSKERSNTALMVRGCGLSGESDEYISLCDYSEILCHLAGIEYNKEFTDSNLPVCFGGETERDFTITETIHVNDPYQIAIHAKDYDYYLDGTEAVTDDCRILLNDYHTALVDKSGAEMDNKELEMQLTAFCLERIAPNLYYPEE